MIRTTEFSQSINPRVFPLGRKTLWIFWKDLRPSLLGASPTSFDSEAEGWAAKRIFLNCGKS